MRILVFYLRFFTLKVSVLLQVSILLSGLLFLSFYSFGLSSF